ncbi:hypothetical protein D3C81_1417810 [compost metagenome]
MFVWYVQPPQRANQMVGLKPLHLAWVNNFERLTILTKGTLDGVVVYAVHLIHAGGIEQHMGPNSGK